MDIIHYYGQTRKEAVDKAISEHGKDIYVLNETPKNLTNGLIGISIIPAEETIDDLEFESENSNEDLVETPITTLRKLALNFENKYAGKLENSKKVNAKKIDQSSNHFKYSTTGKEKLNLSHIEMRLNSIESLIDQLNNSKKIEYYNHPIFLQLINSGIPTTTISDWFLRIINTGIDPFHKPETFNEQISKYLANIVGNNLGQPLEPHTVYFGDTLSNKRSIIIELIDYIRSKNSAQTIGVIIIDPEKKYQKRLELDFYCTKYSIPCIEINDSITLHDVCNKWQQFDYLLFDTPDIIQDDIHSSNTFETIIELINSLENPLEKIWVQNSATCHNSINIKWVNEQIRANQIIFSHFDQVQKLGSLLSYLDDLKASCKMLHTENSKEEKLKLFEPKWFIGKLLDQV